MFTVLSNDVDMFFSFQLIGCWTLCLRAQTQSSWDSVLIRDTYAKILSAAVCIKPKVSGLFKSRSCKVEHL